MEMKLYELLRCDTSNRALFQPAVWAAGVHTSAWLGIYPYDKVMFVVPIGAANDAAATLQIQVLEATSNGGAGAQVLKAATLITAGAGFAALDQLVYVHVEIPEMTINTGYGFLALRFTISAGDTWNVSGISIRTQREYMAVPGGATEIVD